MLDRSPLAYQYYSDACATYVTLIYSPSTHIALPNKGQIYSVEADKAELRHFFERFYRLDVRFNLIRRR